MPKALLGREVMGQQEWREVFTPLGRRMVQGPDHRLGWLAAIAGMVGGSNGGVNQGCYKSHSGNGIQLRDYVKRQRRPKLGRYVEWGRAGGSGTPLPTPHSGSLRRHAAALQVERL